MSGRSFGSGPLVPKSKADAHKRTAVQSRGTVCFTFTDQLKPGIRRLQFFFGAVQLDEEDDLNHHSRT